MAQKLYAANIRRGLVFEWFDYNHLPKNFSFDSRECLQYVVKYGGL